MFRVFVRNWWRRSDTNPNVLIPCAGRKTTLENNVRTEAQARAIAKQYNSTHNPGKFSRKAEYEET